MSTPVPSVGQTVHYQSYATPLRDDGTRTHESQCQAAIVTNARGVNESGTVVSLAVLNDDVPEVRFVLFVNEGSTDHVSGTWHYPEVV